MASTNNIQNGTSSPSSSCSECLYDVFLSFGGDTRHSFTDHLYDALVSDKEIKTFRDSEELETGKPIKSELSEAIEKSRIAVVILSEKYASSTWCLEELAKILECMDAGRMGVRPIFYKVEPRDVRNLKGTFGDAFAKHVLAIVNPGKERFKENVEKNVQRWIDALTRVGHLSGKHLKPNE
jgi:hypothetical protein